MSEPTNDTQGEDEAAEAGPTIEHTAIHEAGHLMAVYLTGNYEDLSATIVPGKGYMGRAVGMDVASSVEDAQDWCFAAAGGYAGLLVTGHTEAIARLGTWHDFDVLQGYASGWHLPGLEHQLQQAVERLSAAPAVAAIRAVADELLKHKTVCGQWLANRIEYAMGEMPPQEWAFFEKNFFANGGTVHGGLEQHFEWQASEAERRDADQDRGMNEEQWAAFVQRCVAVSERGAH